MNEHKIEYVKPEEKLYNLAIDEINTDWKKFLFDLIEKEGLDPFDIDIIKFTKIYLETINELKKINFNITGRFLTIAVFLLKKKTEILLQKDLVGYEDKIRTIENIDVDDEDGFECFEDFTNELETLNKKREKYKINFRNPLARKKKVSINDLIKILEKTLKQSEVRQENFFQRKQKIDYNGPDFTKKKKDLKEIIEELYSQILVEFGEDAKKSIKFSGILKDINTKIEILEKFISLLHLHNQDKIIVKQNKHFEEIEIHKRI
jgi:chromatin segregation and condensation protein Rec8/ScpA/Scc1 (kleisin family)